MITLQHFLKTFSDLKSEFVNELKILKFVLIPSTWGKCTYKDNTIKS